VDDLQRALCTLKNITKQFGMKVSPFKSNVIIFEGEVPIRSKILVGNNILEQVRTFHAEKK
jgi:hypothetical protein